MRTVEDEGPRSAAPGTKKETKNESPKWRAASGCVRGNSHVRSGQPNQDAVQSLVSVKPGGAIAIAAVSDGHGSARHCRSQVGSSLAVNAAVHLVEEFLSSYPHPPDEEESGAALVAELEANLVKRWLASITADVELNPFTPEELALIEEGGENGARAAAAIAYGATLLVAAATDSSVLYLQLGDGDILCVNQNGETKRPLPDDERLVANQTTSLCQPEAAKEFRSSWSSGPAPALVLLSSDGYSNSFRSEEDFMATGEDYLKMVREGGLDALAEELPEILREASEQGSGDDISLAILQGDISRSRGEAPAPPAPSPAKSQSAFIRQLTAQNGSQQKTIDDLSRRVQKAAGEARRFKLLVALMLALVIALIVVLALTPVGRSFYGRFLGHGGWAPVKDHPGKTVGSKAVGSKTAGAPLPPLNPPADQGASEGAGQARWSLKLDGGKSIPLTKGRYILGDQIKAGWGRTLYAEVAEEHGSLELINRSHDAWKVAGGAAAKTAAPDSKSAQPGKGKAAQNAAKRESAGDTVEVIGFGEQVGLRALRRIIFRAGVGGEFVEQPAPEKRSQKASGAKE